MMMKSHAKEAKLAILFFLLASAAILLTRFNGGVALLWIANAPLIVHLCRCDTASQWRSTLAWSTPASVAASTLFGPVAWAGPMFGSASIIEAMTAALLLRRWLGTRDYFESTRSVMIFTGIAGIAAPITGALIGATVAVFAFGKPWVATLVDWGLGRGLGTLITIPIVLLLVEGDRKAWLGRLRSQLWGEGGALLATVALVTAGAFSQQRLPLLFLPALPILLATFKLGRPGAALSILLVALIGGSVTAAGHGPIMLTTLSRVEQLQFFQIYLAATFLMSLPMASALGQREQLIIKVQENNRLFEIAASLASIGHWRLDLAGNCLTWSDEVFRIHGMEPAVPPTLAAAMNYYHPDDRARVTAIVKGAISERRDFSYDARLIRADGSIRHVVTQAQIEVDETGAPRAIFGVFQDVTERELAATALRDSEARFRLITEQASDMIALIDFEGTCLFMSPASQTILGTSPAEMIGTTLIDRVHEADQEAIRRYRIGLHTRVVAAGTSQRFRMRREDGEYAWLEASSRLSEIGGTPCLVAVWRDVTGQVAIESELKSAKAEAEAASVAKAGFLANMSHEIRTPMNGVIGFTDLLLTSDLNVEQRHQAELIAASGRAMMRLLNDILDFSKVEAGQMQIANESFDLRHAINACVTLVRPTVERNGVALHVEFSDALPKLVRGDGLRLRQIILNLLGNAAKFTRQGSIKVRVAPVVDANDATLAIAVEDTGIGIPRDRQVAIFEAFVQAEATTASKFGGTGLGLPISARLAALMGGRLALDDDVGGGSRFVLTLPLVPSEEGSSDTAKPVVEAGTTLAAAHRSEPDRRGRVLVAEDHDVNQLLITAMLKPLGWDADIAANGSEAIVMIDAARVKGQPYHLVLMDIQMPVMDGAEATRQLRAKGIVASELPIVALTANAYADDITACLSAGMQDHLAKPLTLASLDKVLRQWGKLRVAPYSQPGLSPTHAGPGAKVRERYRVRKQETLEALDELVRRGLFSDAELTNVKDLLHKLAGTAGMFQEAALGDRARILEDGLRDWSDDQRVDRIRAAVADIRNAA